jgi:hypothetical protein
MSLPINGIARYHQLLSARLVKHVERAGTSLIGHCQEGKNSPGALRRSAGVNLF